MIHTRHPRLARVLVVGTLLSIMLPTLSAVAASEAAAPTAASTECSWRANTQTNPTWAKLTATTLTECAVTVGAQGAQAHHPQVQGRWAAREFSVKNTGQVYWADTGRLAGSLPDTDSDSIRYDACPTEAETANNIFDTDGCADELQDLMDLVEKDIDSFWADQVDDYASPRTVQAYQARSRTRTGCGRPVPNNAFYCPRDQGIYYDYAFLERLANRGDFGPVAVLAHEWGHYMQHQLGLRNRYTINAELQADCFAGAYTKYLTDGQSSLAKIEEGDAEEGARLLYLLGDPEGTPWQDEEAHGTSEQRYAAFMKGLENGINACVKTA